MRFEGIWFIKWCDKFNVIHVGAIIRFNKIARYNEKAPYLQIFNKSYRICRLVRALTYDTVIGNQSKV